MFANLSSFESSIEFSRTIHLEGVESEFKIPEFKILSKTKQKVHPDAFEDTKSIEKDYLVIKGEASTVTICVSFYFYVEASDTQIIGNAKILEQNEKNHEFQLLSPHYQEERIIRFRIIQPGEEGLAFRSPNKYLYLRG